MESSLDTSVLRRKKPVVEEGHSVGEQLKEKAPVTVEHSQAAVSKESERKTLPAKRFDCFVMITDLTKDILFYFDN